MLLDEWVGVFNSLSSDLKGRDVEGYIYLFGDIINGLLWAGLVGWSISLVKRRKKNKRREENDYKLAELIESFLVFEGITPDKYSIPKFLIKNEKELLIALDYFLRKDAILRKKLRFKQLDVKLSEDRIKIRFKSIFRTGAYAVSTDSSKLLIFLGLLLEKNKNG
ncbi:hypothetical protein [Klebsiella phage phiKp_32]|nr:hypothetical protein [Klebsiella phage phiKp_32]